MKIPPLRRLSVEDYKDQAKWIEPLLNQLNDFFERTTTALRGLTIADNFAGEIKVVELDGTYPVKVRWNQKVRPLAVLVGDTARSDATSFSLTDAVQVQWSFNQAGQLQINGVTGITPSSAAKYQVTLVCLTG